MPLAAIIFDVDGTLAETEELHRQAFNEVFAEHDLPWVWDRRLYGELLKITGGKERLLYYIRCVHPAMLATLEHRVAGIHAEKNARFKALVEQHPMALRPGVERLIADARRSDVKLAIATTTSRENVTALLASTLGAEGIRCFEVIVAGDEVAQKKPDPAVYVEALRQLRLDPHMGLAVEDSCNGLASARAAGLPTVVTPSLYTHHEAFDGALAVLSDLGEPDRAFQHLAGKGAQDKLVDIKVLRYWITVA